MTPVSAAQRRRAFFASRPLAEAMMLHPGDVFPLRSRSRPGVVYEMVVGPDGIIVHQGEGCEGETFNGPTACWHSKNSQRYVMTTQAVTSYQPGALVRQFTDEDLSVLKQTICKGASDAELSLFIATCKHTGLDPFLKQIYAIKRKINNGTKDNPKWEEVLSIQVGIDGYRLIADRTREMEGMDGPQWSADGKEWLDAWHLDGQPRFARVGIWRKGTPRAFTAICRWEAYNQGNALWARMGPEQLAKCAEALALRRAFPAEMAGLPTQPDFVDLDEFAITSPESAQIDAPEAIDGEVVTHGDTQPTKAAASAGEPEHAGEPAASPPITDEQKRALTTALQEIAHTWDKPSVEALYGELRRKWPRCFQANMNRLSALSEGEADEIMARLHPPTPEDPCAHGHEGTATEDGSFVCARCGVGLDEETGLPIGAQAGQATLPVS